MYPLFFICAYLGASFQEWFAHKHLMHRKTFPIFDSLFRNHMLHHKTTKEDYTIVNNNAEYICVEFFSADGIVQSIVLFSLNTGFYYFIFHPTVSLTAISITVAMLLFINVLVWNTIHSYVHGFDPAVICSPGGVPRKYIYENGIITSWLIENHRRHHDNKNSNYNIVFPGADLIMGTYSK